MRDLFRSFKYDENGRPVMVLRKKQHGRAYSSSPRAIKSFAIRLEDVWMYSQDHNPMFKDHMFKICMSLCDIFDLGLATSRKMAELATLIEEGIDDLVAMPPQPEETVTIGEVTMTTRGMSGDRVDGESSITKDLVVGKPISETIH